MRILMILFLFALTACGDGRAIVTGAGTVDQRSAAQERLFTAQQCLRRSSLASLRDSNRSRVCGFEHRIITSGMLQTTGVTSDGVRVLVGYANDVTYVDTCTTTEPTTLACGNDLLQQPQAGPTISEVAATRRPQRTLLICDSAVQAYGAIGSSALRELANSNVINGCEREPEPTDASSRYLDRVGFTTDSALAAVIEYSFPRLGSKGAFYAIEVCPRWVMRSNARCVNRR